MEHETDRTYPAFASDWERGVHAVEAVNADHQMQKRIAGLEREIDLHTNKAARAQARLDAIRRVPAVDPWKDGTILRVRRSGATFVALRVNGLWYTTGKIGPHKVAWRAFAEWLAGGDVELVDEVIVTRVRHALTGGRGGMVDQPLETAARCDDVNSPHAPHVWMQGLNWCEGA